ncbi:carbohydrate ABC transporter permease [Aeromicrobium sp. P5_D10]
MTDLLFQRPARSRSASVFHEGSRKLIKALTVILLIAYGVISLYPFVLMVSGSLQNSTDVISNPWPWPRDPSLDTLRETWNKLDFATYLKNSAIIAGLTCLLVLLVFPIAGYAFAVLRFPFRRTLFALFAATIFVPGVTVLLPVVLLDSKLNLMGTPWAVVLPLANGAGPVALILLRAYFATIPKELREAAILDGAGELRVYWTIYFPLARAPLVTVVLLNFVGSWNEYVLPSVTSTDAAQYPLPVGLQNLLSTNVVEWNQVMAGALLLVAPVLVLFVFLQRFFVSGVEGSVKG